MNKKAEDVPMELQNSEEAIAFYRLGMELGNLSSEQSVLFAQAADRIIRQYIIVDWPTKLDVVRKMNFYIGEYGIDELGMPIREAEELADKCMEVARLRYKA